MSTTGFESRKRSHLELARETRTQAIGQSGLDAIVLEHDALPEHDFVDVSIATTFRGRPLATPFFVSGMTAGHAGARDLNLLLARTCARRGWIFGVGSQRRELDGTASKAGASVDAWQRLREENTELAVIGNLGLSQAISSDLPALESLVENLGADALAIHLNALQEVMQPEGTPTFRGGLAAIKRLSTRLSVPIVLKETGCGFSEKTLRKLRGMRLLAIDVSGLGGTHWGRIEGLRAGAAGDELRRQAAETFAQWGVSTVESLRAALRVFGAGKPSRTRPELWASGGVRSGLDAAKLIAIGADRVGFAQPALEAALAGPDTLEAWMERVEFELKTAVFCTGAGTVAELRKRASGTVRKKGKSRGGK